MTVIETSEGLDAQPEMLRPNGTTLCESIISDELACLLDASGTHTILVRDLSGKDTGTYQVSLLCLTPACGSSSPSHLQSRFQLRLRYVFTYMVRVSTVDSRAWEPGLRGN